MKNEKSNLNTDERFWQLMDLADEGDECATAELWQVYGFTYGTDTVPVTNDRLIQSVFSATEEAKSRALSILEGKVSSRNCLADGVEAPLLMGMSESARFLGVSRATLWRMIRAGRLTKVEIYHNAFRLRRSDILALVNSKEAVRG